MANPAPQQQVQIDPNDLDLIDDPDVSPDDVWAEFDRMESEEGTANAAAAAPPAEEEAPPQDDSGDDDEGEEEKGAAAGDDGGQVPPDDAAAGAAPAASPQSAPQTEDIWQNASAEQRAAYWKAVNAARSAEGRLSAVHRQMNEIQRRPALQAQKAPPAQQGSAVAQPGNDTAPADTGISDDDWAALRQDYPDLVGPLERRFAAVQEIEQRLQRFEQQHETDRHAAHVAQQETALLAQHPDYQQIGATDDFLAWVQQQPGFLQDAVRRNASMIVDANEAGAILSQYKASRGHGQQAAPQPGQPITSSPRNTGAAASAPHQQQSSARRQAQLSSAPVLRGRTAHQPAGIPADGDPKAIWEAFDAMEAQQKR